jgi:ArsR family transcriptional regulator
MVDALMIVNMYTRSMAKIQLTSTAAPPEACCAQPFVEVLDAQEAEDLAQAFAALADPVRLRILSMVSEAGESCGCELTAPLGKSQPTISHHTKVLAEAGLLRGEKRGKWVWWSVDRKRVRALRDALKG